MTGIANLLLAAGVVPRLHELNLDYDHIEPPVHAQALVDAAGTSLDTLWLSFGVGHINDRIAESAEHCASLSVY